MKAEPRSRPRPDLPVEEVRASAYRIPTDGPEEDGSLSWDSTVLVVAEAVAGGAAGQGYSYADRSTAVLIRDRLAPLIVGADALSVESSHAAMTGGLRNLGTAGISAMAVSAVDNALWDLKARLLGLPLARLLGQVRDAAPAYGSGGFTNYGEDRLRSQLEGWIRDGFGSVKMKVGARPEADRARVEAARRAVGPLAGLYVDANGGYSREQALGVAVRFAEQGVTWFEEPVPSWDVEGTRTVCQGLPAGMETVGGEYGYRLPQFLRLLQAGAVDSLQADATRCGGITGFLKVSALCEAFNVPLSSHCAPSLHVSLGCALAPLRILEWFHDHVRIEEMLFDGFRRPESGMLSPDPDRPGLGLELKRGDAERFAI
jgi:L-alanine-DL-glutamate epimerase-like enolase superfamily enzyme